MRSSTSNARPEVKGGEGVGPRMRTLLAISLLFSVIASSTEAQNCRKGVGQGTARSVAQRPVAKETSATPRSLVTSTSSEHSGPAATAAKFPWVGSFGDGVYFHADCPAAQVWLQQSTIPQDDSGLRGTPCLGL
jgi:hypothetical protein